MSNKWYIIHSASGSEKKVIQEIEERAKKNNMIEYFEEMLVPVENVTEVKRGKKVETEKKLFPGYILIKMNLTDESWKLVRDLRKVTGFLGDGKKPIAIDEDEVNRVYKQMQEGTNFASSSMSFSVGETIKIIDGPFESFNAVVEGVDHEKSKLKVSVSIFGRSTPVELDFMQVVKEDH